MVVCVYVVLRLFHTLKGVRKISKLKRRDNKGRILNTGESQRKDGRYTYKYVDAMGKTRYVYSWKLLPTDRMPKGKRDDLLLSGKLNDAQSSALIRTVFTPAGCSGHFIQYRFGSLF